MSLQLSNVPNNPSTLPPIVDAEDGEIILRNRVKDPSALQSVWNGLFIADFQAMRARALVQSEVDGNPPFSEGRDRIHGMAGRTNVNFGYLSQSQREVEEPYIQLFHAIDQFGMVPTEFGDEQQKLTWSQIISEEISRMVKNWSDFNFNVQLCVHQFTMFGVSFTFREDKYDWRWKVYDLQYLKLPRRTRATINDVDLVVCKVEMLPSELHRKIENRDAAIKAGWNPDEVLKAIKTAQQRSPDTSNPQETQQTYKDQDYFSGLSATTVQLIHGWIAEVDGTITHVIGRYDGQGDWLYKCEGVYNHMSQLITAYTYGVGSNGDFYALRGNGWNGHNGSVMLNLMTCKFMDQAIFAATPAIQASSEDAVIDQMIQPRGPYNVVLQGTSFPEVPHVPFKDSLIPAIGSLTNIFNMRTSSFRVGMSQDGKTPKTAEEIQSANAVQGRLATGGIDLFFDSWKNDFKEIVRRACNKDYPAGHGGWKEVLEFRKRCIKRGVPIEAIYAVDVDGIEINQGLGKGSVLERRTAAGAVMNVMDRLDADGQQIALRTYLASHTDVAYANMLVPKQPGQRPPMDLQIANMENALMGLGQPAVIEPNQNHVIHVGTHLQKLDEVNTALSQLQIEMEQAIPQMQMIWQHAGEHMQFISQRNPLFKIYKEELQQLGEVVINGAKHLEAQQRKAAEQAQQAGEEVPAQESAMLSTDRQAVDAAARIAMLDAQKKALELDFAAKKSAQELAQNDAKFAQQTAQNALKMRMMAQKQANNRIA
jgi:hypothetical protein